MVMNKKEAFEILQIPENTVLTEDIIKKHYRMMALKYHPDKNHEIDTSIKFQEIHDAYEYLSNGYATNREESKTYDSLLYIFINQIFDDDFQKQIIYILISRILKTTSNRIMDLSLKFLERIDVSVLKKICDFLTFYADIFESSLHFTEKISEIIKKKEYSVFKNTEKRIEYIILHPLLEDLFENNVYRLVERGQTIVVPLWHHELVYDVFDEDKSKMELYVECYPILPENITIDEENNIHISIKYKLKQIWYLNQIEFALGNRLFNIERTELLMLDFQKYIIKGEGISRINEKDIYDVSERGDVILYIEIIDE